MRINGRMELQNDIALEKRIVGEHTVLLLWDIVCVLIMCSGCVRWYCIWFVTDLRVNRGDMRGDSKCLYLVE